MTVEAFSAAGGEQDLLRRVLDVERRSWKGPAGTGLFSPGLLAFYRSLVRRLLGEGRLRALFARREGEDLGYILGGVGPGIYRGFQFSFDRRWPELSLGGLLQEAQIASLAAEGVQTYDLGIDIGYKRRWGDRAIETSTLAVVRR